MYLIWFAIAFIKLGPRTDVTLKSINMKMTRYPSFRDNDRQSYRAQSVVVITYSYVKRMLWMFGLVILVCKDSV